MKTAKPIQRIIPSLSLLEGGGFPVHRPFPIQACKQIDPFLLLDQMGPVDWPPNQAIGAPTHPHKGFETVTYLLEGAMNHRDSAGHAGKLTPGDVQWMTAGSGVLHSELPDPEFQKTGGVMNGFQLWVNLPASKKLQPPHYQEIPSKEIPTLENEQGKVKIIAGTYQGTSSPIQTTTPIAYFHIFLKAGEVFEYTPPASWNSMLYLFKGEASVPDQQSIALYDLVHFANQEGVIQVETTSEAELLFLGGEPIGEPIARQGPFVMNTQAELQIAFQEYESGKMGSIDPL